MKKWEKFCKDWPEIAEAFDERFGRDEITVGDKDYKKYVVMTDYYTEGWVISGETDDFREAVVMRNDSMGQGNSRVVIFKPVTLVYSELKEKG